VPKIYGGRIVLREYRKEDLESIRGWVNDPEIADNLSDIFLYPSTLNQTESFLNYVLDGKSDKEAHFIIAEKETESYIGQIDLMGIDWKNRCAELGIVIGQKECLGRGIGTEAIRLLLMFAFDRMNLNRVELRVHDYNERAYNCYLKCGFREEGRLKQRHFYQGTYGDVILMAVLKEEFLAENS
jgi:RimJ/RimL family protein N-acetyltransferase